MGGDEAGDDVEDDVGEDAPAADVKHRGARVPDIRREAKLSNKVVFKVVDLIIDGAVFCMQMRMYISF